MANLGPHWLERALRLVPSASVWNLLLLLVLLVPAGSRRLLARMDAVLRSAARHRTACIVGVGLAAFVLAGSVSLLVRFPQPGVHDEFSYLLAADTFAHGRLANPTPPLWRHFQAFHELMRPTYASMYPPGQGLILALGQVVCGAPIAGAWLSFGLAAGALVWMLQGWLPPRWALFGGLLALVYPRLFTWSQSYWGGLLAVFGGALVLGAVPRLLHRPRVGTALVLGLGIAVLANTRPFEGLILCILAGIGLVAGWARSRPAPAGLVLRRAGLPLLLVLGLTAAAMAIYNARVTGDPLRLPFQEQRAQVAMTPYFLWQHLEPEPHLGIAVFRDFYTRWEPAAFRAQTTPFGFTVASAKKLAIMFTSWFPLAVLAIPLLGLPRLLRRSLRVRVAALGLVLFTVALLGETFMQEHYVAPAFGLALVLWLSGARVLGLWTFGGRPAGRALVWALLLVCAVSVGGWCAVAHGKRDGWPYQRAQMIEHLEQRGGKHLVIVRYAPGHSFYEEWVWNRADLEGASVVWARDLGPAANRQLRNHFEDRRVWLLEPDTRPATLVPYPRGE